MQSKVDALYVVGHVVKQHNCKLSWNIYLSLLIVHGSEAHNSQVCCVLGNTSSLWESFTNFNKIFYKRISVSLNGIGTKKWVDLFGLDFIISPSIWYKTNEVHGTSICLFPDTCLNKTVIHPRVNLWFWQLAQTQGRQADLRFVKKIYTTGFSGKKFYTLKVRKLRLFLLKEKQCKCIYISYFSSFFVRI